MRMQGHPRWWAVARLVADEVPSLREAGCSMTPLADRILARAGRPGGAARYQIVQIAAHSQRPTARKLIDALVDAAP